MTKVIILSIQSQHAVNILNGKKTLELRTWIPKGYVGWVYVYLTKGKPYLVKFYNDYPIQAINYYTYQELLDDGNVPMNGKVAFRFWFDEYDTLEYIHQWGGSDYIGNNQSVSWNVDSNYLDKLRLDYQDVLDYGFKTKPHHHQTDLYAWHIKDLEIFDKPMELKNFHKLSVGKETSAYIRLDKAPQSWQYVYVKGESK